MTAQTIKLVDTYCDAANWHSCVKSVTSERDRYLEAGNSRYLAEAEGEIVVWSERRDKALAKLRIINDNLTDYEKDWVRRKCGGDRLAQNFRKLGVEPSWDSIEDLM
jgi:hypothetical protein